MIRLQHPLDGLYHATDSKEAERLDAVEAYRHVDLQLTLLGMLTVSVTVLGLFISPMIPRSAESGGAFLGCNLSQLRERPGRD